QEVGETTARARSSTVASVRGIRRHGSLSRVVRRHEGRSFHHWSVPLRGGGEVLGEDAPPRRHQRGCYHPSPLWLTPPPGGTCARIQGVRGPGTQNLTPAGC